jgi:hypothetical protein
MRKDRTVLPTDHRVDCSPMTTTRGRPPQGAPVQRSVLWSLQKNGHIYTYELKFWEDGSGTEG